ncbi:hypothetical protein V2J09_006008 [Rumex salicifolius]
MPISSLDFSTISTTPPPSQLLLHSSNPCAANLRFSPSIRGTSMALTAVHVSEIPNLDQVPENASLVRYATGFSGGVGRSSFKAPKFLVIGHRGHGMNLLQSSDPRMKAFKENSILSFNSAANFPVDFVEFDVQVTKDGYPIIFHDNFILSEEQGSIYEKRVTDLTLNEFLSYGPQKESGNSGKPLLRKTKDGKIRNWNVDKDDTHCTLQEAFEKVDSRLGFNIELKLDDYIVYEPDHLTNILTSILQVVMEYAKNRPVMFSSFQPDAALQMKKLQGKYTVFFLTNGGNELYYDVRRNSLEEALKLCLEGGLEGIVSEVKGIFKNPGTVSKIKDSNLSLLTYGQLNNVPEAVYMQHLMGVDGVIVDLVREITEAVTSYNLSKPLTVVEEAEAAREEKLRFNERELAFLLKLIPELIQK